jgi:hypothetical protein
MALADLLNVDIADSADRAVTQDQAKNYAHIDASVDDGLVDILIAGAQKAFEHYTSKLLYERTVTAAFYGGNTLILPWLPVIDITSVQNDGSDISYTRYGNTIVCDIADKITVTYTAGLFTDTVDEQIQTGLLKWINSQYNDRDDIIGGLTQISEMPNNHKTNWDGYRYISV